MRVRERVRLHLGSGRGTARTGGNVICLCERRKRSVCVCVLYHKDASDEEKKGTKSGKREIYTNELLLLLAHSNALSERRKKTKRWSAATSEPRVSLSSSFNSKGTEK